VRPRRDLSAEAPGQRGIADRLPRPELLPLWRALGGEAVAVACAIARSFAALGARVFGGERSAEELEETADRPGAIHIRAFALTAPRDIPARRARRRCGRATRSS